MRVIFMGTPEFAIPSLSGILKAGIQVEAVVTSPDKPAGRGQKMRSSPIKEFAKKKGLRVLQPNNLKSEDFIDELQSLNPDLIMVVAFRMLPEAVWSIPPKGTVNLHASLLPHYRGAAPINWAVINGEPKTGVTTFFIQREIDTGKIILQKEVEIGPDETAGELHDRLMEVGGELVVDTIHAIEKGDYEPVDQQSLLNTGEKPKMAPKIFKEDCKINWHKNVDEVYNLIRGLSPYPAAWTEIESGSNSYSLKIYGARKIGEDHQETPGKIFSDHKSYLRVAVKNGFIELNYIQLAGKKKMQVDEFLRGFKEINEYKFIS